jgi:large exoprotein involved in heme utilization and adhesion
VQETGGDIDLKADSILAFDDSDILAYARNGTGGDITLNTPAFFGENYRPAPRNTDPDTLDLNNQVDVNAELVLYSGVITTPDVSFIQNSLTELPENQIDTDSLLAIAALSAAINPPGKLHHHRDWWLTAAPRRCSDVHLSHSRHRNSTQ